MTYRNPQDGDVQIKLRDLDEARVLLGPLDSNVRLVREAHGVSVLIREGHIRLLGDERAVEFVRQVFQDALDALRNGQPVSTGQIGTQLHGAPSEDGDLAAIERGGHGMSTVKPRSAGQRAYLKAMDENDVVFGVGPAGTGKTYLAVAAAVQAVRNAEVRRIVLVRPAVEAGEKLGFLPGDFQAKVDPYMRPLYDALHDLLDAGLRQNYLESDVIEVCPLAYMRGRTLNHAFVILDEAQNTTTPQMLMFLSRLGEGSRMVVTGDPSQVDLPSNVTSGLMDAVRRLEGVQGVVVARLQNADIVRHEVVQRILRAYGDKT